MVRKHKYTHILLHKMERPVQMSHRSHPQILQNEKLSGCLSHGSISQMRHDRNPVAACKPRRNQDHFTEINMLYFNRLLVKVKCSGKEL